MIEWLDSILKNESIEDKLQAIEKELPLHFVKKTDFNQRGEELKATKEKMDDLQGQVEKLSTSTEEVETLKEQLKTVNNDFETFKTDADKRVLNMQKKNAIKKALYDANANPDAVDLLISEFAIDELQLDSKGNIVDLEQHLKPIKETRKSLFGEIVIEGPELHKGKDKPLTATTLKGLTSEERLKLREENPERYKQLRQELIN